MLYIASGWDCGNIHEFLVGSWDWISRKNDTRCLRPFHRVSRRPNKAPRRFPVRRAVHLSLSGCIRSSFVFWMVSSWCKNIGSSCFISGLSCRNQRKTRATGWVHSTNAHMRTRTCKVLRRSYICSWLVLKIHHTPPLPAIIMMEVDHMAPFCPNDHEFPHMNYRVLPSIFHDLRVSHGPGTFPVTCMFNDCSGKPRGSAHRVTSHLGGTT